MIHTYMICFHSIENWGEIIERISNETYFNAHECTQKKTTVKSGL